MRRKHTKPSGDGRQTKSVPLSIEMTWSPRLGHFNRATTAPCPHTFSGQPPEQPQQQRPTPRPPRPRGDSETLRVKRRWAIHARASNPWNDRSQSQPNNDRVDLVGFPLKWDQQTPSPLIPQRFKIVLTSSHSLNLPSRYLSVGVRVRWSVRISSCTAPRLHVDEKPVVFFGGSHSFLVFGFLVSSKWWVYRWQTKNNEIVLFS